MRSRREHPTGKMEVHMSRLQLFDPDLNDPMEAMFRRLFWPARIESPIPSMSMRLDVAEKDGAYLIKADLPGVRKEDISIRIEGNLVHIEAQSRQEKETRGEGEKILRSERHYGTISRTLGLAEDVDDAKANARYDNGVLTLELPKRKGAATRRIAVQ
jgi:HSP20 family protein